MLIAIMYDILLFFKLKHLSHYGGSKFHCGDTLSHYFKAFWVDRSANPLQNPKLENIHVYNQ